MDNFKTRIAFWSEADPGNRFRPVGLMSTRVQSAPLKTWQRRTVFERDENAATLISSWQVIFARQFVVDDLCRLLQAAVCDSVATADGLTSGVIGPRPLAVPMTFGLDVQYPDGSCRRLEGMALGKWEIVMQSRRVVVEEITFQALKASTIDAVELLAQPVRELITGKHACHAFRAPQVAISDATFPAEKTRTFSTQIIIDRTLDACNYDTHGTAEKHSFGPWQVTGQDVARLPSSQFIGAVGSDLKVTANWQLTDPAGGQFLFALPAALCRINNQEALGGEIEHAVDFHAQSVNAVQAFIQIQA